YKTFLSNNFDPKEYANSTINNSSTNGDGDGDIAIALAKLSFSIESLNKQIHDKVVANYEDLISLAFGIKDLENVLGTLKNGIQSLNTSLDSLKTRVYTPYSQMKNFIIQLERLQAASDLLRQVVRFLSLVRCIENQLSEIDNDDNNSEDNNRDKSAHYLELATNLSELETLLQEVNFDGINCVQTNLYIIQKARIKIKHGALQSLEKKSIQ
ncbi:7746_t:CDS:2, partial [Entrophospora sp. SA101]